MDVRCQPALDGRFVPDAAARRTVRTALDRPLFLTGGGGTGKTTGLVGRVVTALAAGVRGGVAGVAVLSPTENAALALRGGIQAALGEAASNRWLPEPARNRLTAAADHLNDAVLTTLAGFARRLVIEHPIEAGLPPRFSVRDELSASLGLDDWWGRVVPEALADPDLTGSWQTAAALGLAPPRLRPVADVLQSAGEGLGQLGVEPVSLPLWRLESVLAPLRAAIQYGSVGPAGDELTTYLHDVLAPALVDLDAETDESRRVAALARLRIDDHAGDAEAWDSADLDRGEVLRALRRAAAERDEHVDAARRAVLSILLSWLRSAVLTETRRRRAAGTLHPRDMLLLARDLLVENDDVLASLRQRWPVVLVDELPERDRLQLELVHLLTANVGEHAVVAVGSEQAIDQLDHQAQPPGTEVLALRQNLRARPRIVATANAALDGLWAEADMGGGRNLVLHPGRRGPSIGGDGPDVLLLGGASEGDAAEVRMTEARHVATACRRVVEERWQVRAPSPADSEATQDASYRDVTVLLPNGGNLAELETALHASDVPYSIGCPSLTWQSRAVLDVLAVLEAVAHPTDALAVVAALRTPVFNCTDQDLTRWQRAGSHWDYRLASTAQPPGSGDDTVAASLRALRRYAELNRELTIDRLVELVIGELTLAESPTSGAPRDSLHRVTELARVCAESNNDGLSAFLRWGREQARHDDVDEAVPETRSEDGAVRVLTIRAAEGREFPIVMLTGMTGRIGAAPPAVLLDGRLEVAVEGFSTPRWARASAELERRAAMESVRSLSVAVTRAADHLVMSLYHPLSASFDATNLAARLSAVLPGMTAVGAVWEPRTGSSGG